MTNENEAFHSLNPALPPFFKFLMATPLTLSRPTVKLWRKQLSLPELSFMPWHFFQRGYMAIMNPPSMDAERRGENWAELKIIEAEIQNCCKACNI